MSQKGFSPLLLIILIAVVGLGGYLAYQSVNKSSPTPPPDQVACTQDAKLCPDGSYVSKVGPNCEFSPCPTQKESTPSASCMPRPDCLDATPRCLLPEPANGWCP